MALRAFLLQHQAEILRSTEAKTLLLAGSAPTSTRLKDGLPIFYNQLVAVLAREGRNGVLSREDRELQVQAARASDEPGMAIAGHRPDGAEVALSARVHGEELLRMGYTLSHVVHAYGAMCQSITEQADREYEPITAAEFHDMNRCLDIGVAGAVTGYELKRSTLESQREVTHLDFLAHEMGNALSSVLLSLGS
jgi:hypothetical protein